MLADERRGFVLEQCLTKLMLKECPAQIIGLSATLSSIEKLKKFLNAQIYATNFRPVDLIENIKVGDCIYRYNREEDSFYYSHDVKRIVSIFYVLFNMYCFLAFKVARSR
jgi:replicative superfamily II helicase